MQERIWTPFLTPLDREVFQASGYGATMGYGQRPAMMIVDVNCNFVGDRPEPILDSIKLWRNSCGEAGWRALPVIRRVIDACHAKGLPVFYSTNTRRPDGFDAGSWRWKNSRELEDNDQDIAGNEIVPEIAPNSQDIVVYKTKPSAFFGTPLLSFLIDLKVDSLLVCGVSTSGCVRATVIDAFSNNFRCTVIEDGCFDRVESSHAINLCDMQAKYADVIASADVINFISSLPSDLFQLPTGSNSKR